MIRQQLAPRRDQLIGVEQRHLREGVHVQLHALRRLHLVRGGAAVGAVLATDLRARQVSHRVALAPLPVREPFDPRPLLRHGHRSVGAELMRVLQPAEERKRVAYLVDAHVELRDAAEGEEEMRRLAGGEHLAGREREGRSRVWVGAGGVLRGGGRGRQERDDRGQSGKKGGEQITRSRCHGVCRACKRKMPTKCGLVARGRQRGDGCRASVDSRTLRTSPGSLSPGPV